MLKIVTLKTGNTSWWKNIKYRREAAADLKKYRKSGLKILKIKRQRRLPWKVSLGAIRFLVDIFYAALTQEAAKAKLKAAKLV